MPRDRSRRGLTVVLITSLISAIAACATDRADRRTRYVNARDIGQTITYADTNTTNEYAQIDSQPVVYDDAGNLTEDPRGYRPAYDFENRLIQVSAFDGLAWVVTDRYAYDALGRRIQHNDVTAAEAFIEAHNADRKPLVWTAEVKDILPKIARAHAALDTVAN